MKYIKDTLEFAVAEPSVISLGKFDGLHTGHRYLMEEMKKGKSSGFKSVAFTFDIPPKSVDGSEGKVISTNAEKAEIFRTAGIDYLIECPFTEQIRQMSPLQFLQMLTQKINVRRIVAGTDFRFGYRRSGSYEDLEKYAPQFGYETVIVKKKQYKGEDISSTRIRREIAAGNMEEANSLLGYAHFLSGVVMHGNEIGRTIHIPTANLIPEPEKLLPPNGVYAARILCRGKEYGGIANIGCKPTVGDGYPVGVETFLFDFEGDIYGEAIRVSFLKFIRGERRFASIDELKGQMQRDIAVCRAILAET